MQLVTHMISTASTKPPEMQVVVTVERRQFLKRRWRIAAPDGMEFGFDLETRLTDGCVFFQQDGMDYVMRQLAEKVYQIDCRTPERAALVGWRVGNLHLPAQIGEGFIRVLHDEAMAQLMEREAWEFTEPEVLFTPMKTMAHSL